MIDLESSLIDLVASLVGRRCWYVCAGRNVGSTFNLALGNRIARQTPLKNQFHSKEYRDNDGEGTLLVWCAWRLDKSNEPVASSDQESETVAKELQILIGRRIIAASVGEPPWDLRVEFDEGLRLLVFCDHIPPNPSLKGNWDVTFHGQAIYVGPGTELRTN